MLVKSDKVAKAIAELQQITQTYSTGDERFEQIGRSLTAIATVLREGKLIIHIISSNEQSARILQQRLNSFNGLTEKYQVVVVPLTEQQPTVDSALEPALLLKTSDDKPQRFELSSSQTTTIGRHSSCELCIPDQFLMVSGQHAEIQRVPDSTSPWIWQIVDQSRNGTYVNGKQVHSSQILQEGDRITLGCSYPTETCPEIMFELSLSVSSSGDRSQKLVLDCDVLCFITDSTQPLAAAERHLLMQTSQASLIKCIVISDPSKAADVTASEAYKVNEVRALLQSQAKDCSIDEFAIALQETNSETALTELDAVIRQQIEKLAKLLETLARRKSEDLLAKRLALQVLEQSILIEAFLTAQEKNLQTEQMWNELRLSTLSAHQPGEQISNIFKQVDEDVLLFFKYARENLTQAKARLLDDYLEFSLSNKIQCFVQHLKLYLVQQNRQTYLQLKLPSTDPVKKTFKARKPRLSTLKQTIENVNKSSEADRAINANTALMDYCYAELTHWADKEWHHLCTVYAQGGLEGLLQRTSKQLSAITALRSNHLDAVSIQIEATLDHRQIFDEAFAKPPYSSRYREAHPVLHILKKVRNQWMQFLFLFSFLSILGIAGRKQIMQHLTAPIASAFQHFPLVSSLAMSVFLFLLIKLIIQWYRDDRDLEREEEAKKLRNGLSTYYQSLVKNRLAEKLVQNLMLALDTEEQKIQQIIRKFRLHTETSGLKQSSNQAPLQKRTEECKELQKMLKGDKEKLQKIKRLQSY